MDRWELYVKAQELHDEGKWVLVEDAEAELARLRAENEKLRSDVVWCASNRCYAGGKFVSWWKKPGENNATSYDGTDAGLLDAVRRAREGE